MPTDLRTAVKGLVEGIAERVELRAATHRPTREQVRLLERRIQALERKVATLRSRTKPARVGRPPLHRKCKLASCGLAHVAHGFCSKHYQAWRRKQIRASRGRAGAGKR